MKKITRIISLSLFLFSATVLSSSAQIIINSSDMPSVNNVIVVNNVTPSGSIDPVPTGINFNWDFSALASASQTADTFIAITDIPNIYFLAFLSSFYALHTAPDFSISTFLTFSDIYDIYTKSSSKYEFSGRGAAINSIPTAMVYSPKDLVYKFPLHYADADSATSGFTITIPTLGTYSQFRKRVNVVDGWGTLSLPSGNFNVLRVKSIITDRDSFASPSFPIPIVIPSTTIEYKWLGNSQGEPLLQINTGLAGVTQVRYRDNPVGINDNNELKSSLVVFPSPATTLVSVFYRVDGSSKNSVDVFNTQGEKVKTVFEGMENGDARHTFSVKDLTEGIYFLRILLQKILPIKSLQ